MHRIDTIDRSTTLPPPDDPAASAGYFRKSDPPLAIRGTTVSADWLNDFQENIMTVLSQAGISPTKGRALDFADAIRVLMALQAGPVRLAKVERVSATVIRFKPAIGTKVILDVDGVAASVTGNLDFDMAADLVPSEAASTWYYLYVDEVSGAPVKYIDDVPPDLPGGTKPGYHPTQTGRACVGAWFNNSASDLEPAVMSKGWMRFAGYRSWRRASLGTTLPTNWTTQALNLPETGDVVRLLAHGEAHYATAFYGQSDASTQPATTFDTLADIGDSIACFGGDISADSATKADQFQPFEIPIVDPTDPEFAWALRQSGTSGDRSIANHETLMAAYYDRCAPRF